MLASSCIKEFPVKLGRKSYSIQSRLGPPDKVVLSSLQLLHNIYDKFARPTYPQLQPPNGLQDPSGHSLKVASKPNWSLGITSGSESITTSHTSSLQCSSLQVLYQSFMAHSYTVSWKPGIYMSLSLSLWSTIHPSIRPSIHPSVHRCIHPSINPAIHTGYRDAE